MSVFRRERDIDIELPVHKWVHETYPKPQTEITDMSFKPQSNPNERAEVEARNVQAFVLDRQAAKRAREAAEAPFAMPDNSEFPTYADIYAAKPATETGVDLWPGENSLRSGGRPTEEFEAIVAQLEQKGKFNSSPLDIVKGGLKRALESIASVRAPKVDADKYAKIAKIPVSATKEAAQMGYQQAKEWAKGEEYRETRRKVIKVGAAVGALAVAAVGAYYLEQKGASGIHNATREAVTNHPAKSYSAVPNEFKISLPLPAQAVAAQAGHHAHQVAKHVGYHLEHLKYYGDTISYHAEAKLQSVLGHKPSAAELNDYVKRTLKFNHMNWEKAKEMFRGQSFKLPSVRR